MSYLCKSARVSGFNFLPLIFGASLTRGQIESGFFIMKNDNRGWIIGVVYLVLMIIGGITIVIWIIKLLSRL